jgi:hypothetical protein
MTTGEAEFDELTRPFDACFAPMARVVLLQWGLTTPAAIILTIDDGIADGLSAAYILRDLSSALNGHQLAGLPVPPSQEELIGALRDAQPVAVTTVHPALVAAMSRAIIESGRRAFVRTLTPVGFRNKIGVHGDVCLYFTAARTTFGREQLTDLWQMARMIGAQLAGACSVPTLVAGSAATEEFFPINATAKGAEDFLIATHSFEALACNLRVLDMAHPKLCGRWPSGGQRSLCTSRAN